MQYAIRAVRAAQVGAAGFFFFGEQLFGSLGRRPPALLGQMHENKMLTAAAIYGLDVIAQTMKAINAFEITYNGHLLHSKLTGGAFPQPHELVNRLASIKQKEGSNAAALPHCSRAARRAGSDMTRPASTAPGQGGPPRSHEPAGAQRSTRAFCVHTRLLVR